MHNRVATKLHLTWLPERGETSKVQLMMLANNAQPLYVDEQELFDAENRFVPRRIRNARSYKLEPIRALLPNACQSP